MLFNSILNKLCILVLVWFFHPFTNILANSTSSAVPSYDSLPPGWDLFSTLYHKRMEIQFEVCHGMFNQYRSIAAALWLTSAVASNLTLVMSGHSPNLADKKVSCELLVKLPPVYPSYGYSRTVPFHEMFNLSHLTTTLRQQQKPNSCQVSVAEVTQPPNCPYKIYIFVNMFVYLTSGKRKRRKFVWAKSEEVISFLSNEILTRNSSCLLVRTFGKSPKWRENCLFMVSNIDLAMVYSFGTTLLKFSSRLTTYADQIIRRLQGHYSALHLRVELDAAGFFKFRLHNLTALDTCLLEMIPDLSHYHMYIATGNSMFQHEEYKRWRSQTRFQLYNKSNFLPMSVLVPQLGREEWSVIEATVAIYSHIFIGFSRSSFSEYVMYSRRYLKIEHSKDTMWDYHCGKKILRPHTLWVTRTDELTRLSGK